MSRGVASLVGGRACEVERAGQEVGGEVYVVFEPDGEFVGA